MGCQQARLERCPSQTLPSRRLQAAPPARQVQGIAADHAQCRRAAERSSAGATSAASASPADAACRHRCQQRRKPARGWLVTAAASSAAGAAVSTGPRICVVGGGVVGLTSALRIAREVPGARVTVLAAQFDDTTTHGAGGLWKPYTLGDTPGELVNRWGQATFDHYMQLYRSAEAPEAGTILTAAYQLFREPVTDPEWAPVVPHFRHLTGKELQAYDTEGVHTHGWSYTTFITEGRLYLAWLRRQLERAGVALQQRRVGSVAELAPDFELVVNCAGLGARELVADASMYPVRGQVLRVRAPWVRHYVNTQATGEGDCYIIPNTDTVVLGGTVQRGDGDLAPREEDRRGILERACRVLPSLAAAEIVQEWVGLRPGRPSVRLELEQMPLPGQEASGGGGSRSSIPVVHNYGHGGSGLTLAWGCAADTVQLVQQALEGRNS